MEPSDESVALLARMAAKPGVQATLILSRADGAVLRADNVGALRKGRGARRAGGGGGGGGGGAVARGADGVVPLRERGMSDGAPAAGAGAGKVDANDEGEEKGADEAEEVARIVWRFVRASEGAVEELDAEDEVRLLRVRTRRNELVIVPSSKFLLVVVHDTPPA